MSILQFILFFIICIIFIGANIGIGILISKLILYIIDKIKAPKYNLWVKYQPNPFGKNTSDCSIRAISKIFAVGWIEALDLIVECAKKYGEQTNCSINLNTLMYEKMHMHVYEPKKKMTFEKFAHLHSDGTYALYSKGHICACINGKLYDSWNSSKDKLILYCTQNNKNIQDKDITFDKSNEYVSKMRIDFDD